MGAALQSAPSDDPVFCGRLTPPPEILRRLGAELLPALASRQGPLQVNDLARSPQWAWLAPHARQLLAVPLQRQEQVLGCLFALDKESGDFDSPTPSCCTRSPTRSAIYLENATLFDDVHGLMMGLTAQPHQRGGRQRRLHVRP